MSTVNYMLIPDFQAHPKPGVMKDWYVGIVKDNNDQVLWTAPVGRLWANEALLDAQTAVDLLRYERLHQLPLF